MRFVGKNLFLTGPPGIGKTTIIQKALQRVSCPATGFFTREIREGCQRVGFSIVTLDGREGILAHIRAKGKFSVGRYKVNMEDIERLAVPAMTPRSPQDLIVVDEVGKMECFSQAFQEALIRALDAPNIVLGTVAAKGTGFIESIKSRPDVTILPVSQDNRDGLPDRVAGMLR